MSTDYQSEETSSSSTNKQIKYINTRGWEHTRTPSRVRYASMAWHFSWGCCGLFRPNASCAHQCHHSRYHSGSQKQSTPILLTPLKAFPLRPYLPSRVRSRRRMVIVQLNPLLGGDAYHWGIFFFGRHRSQTAQKDKFPWRQC